MVIWLGYDVEAFKSSRWKLDQYKIEFQKLLGRVYSWSWCWRYQAAANNLSYTQRESRQIPLLATYRKNPFGSSEQKDKALTLFKTSLVKLLKMTLELLLPRLLQTGIKAHPDNPATIQYSGEDVAKRLNDLANGEFDFLIFDKISVQKLSKTED